MCAGLSPDSSNVNLTSGTFFFLINLSAACGLYTIYRMKNKSNSYLLIGFSDLLIYQRAIIILDNTQIIR